MKLKRELGQNLLINRKVLEKEIEIARINKNDVVLEIGAGTGNLTKILAKKAKKVYAIEIDKRFEKQLAEIKKGYPNLKIIFGDALKIKFPKFDKVVSNLPFKKALPIMLKILKHDFKTGVFIVQDLMAKRICAKPGNPRYSKLSVMFRMYSKVRYVKKVSKDSFYPAPKVDAAIIKLKKIKPFEIEEDYFSRILDYLFLFKDKKLKIALKPLKIETSFSNKKVKNLTPREFFEIYKIFAKNKIKIPKISNEVKRKVQKYSTKELIRKIFRTS